jgi:hypothetical protein
MDGDAGVVHRAGTPKALDQKKKYATFLKSSKAKSKANSLCAKSEYRLGRIQVRSSGTSYSGIGVLMFSKVLDLKSVSRIQNTPTYDSSKRSALIAEYGNDETLWPDYIQGGYVGYSIKYKCQNDGPVPSVPTYPAYQIYINGGAIVGQLSYNQLKSWNWSVEFTPRPKPPVVIDLPPVISDLVAPSTVRAGEPITVTYRVRDDNGLIPAFLESTGTKARLMWGESQASSFPVYPSLVSGDNKDGLYTVTFTYTFDLKNTYYTIQIEASDGKSVPVVLSTPIKILP